MSNSTTIYLVKDNGDPIPVSSAVATSIEAVHGEERPSEWTSHQSFSASFEVENTPELAAMLESLNNIHEWMVRQRLIIFFGHNNQ